jgi:hypothetical protein
MKVKADSIQGTLAIVHITDYSKGRTQNDGVSEQDANNNI